MANIKKEVSALVQAFLLLSRVLDTDSILHNMDGAQTTNVFQSVIFLLSNAYHLGVRNK